LHSIGSDKQSLVADYLGGLFRDIAEKWGELDFGVP